MTSLEYQPKAISYRKSKDGADKATKMARWIPRHRGSEAQMARRQASFTFSINYFSTFLIYCTNDE